MMLFHLDDINLYIFQCQLQNEPYDSLKIEGNDEFDDLKNKEKVDYKLTTTFDVEYKSVLICKIKIVIIYKCNKTLALDSNKFLTSDKLDCNIEFNKKAYFAGENVLAKHIANCNSTKETRKIKSKVPQAIEHNIKCHTKRLTFTESSTNRSVFGPCFNYVKYLKFAIPYNIFSSINSQYIPSEY